MLNQTEYTNFRVAIGIPMNAPNSPTYQEYQNYHLLWENYILNIVFPALQQLNNSPSRIGLIEMESAPGGVIHPHPNYIFNNMHNIVGAKDAYLKNIFNGSHLNHGYYTNGLTKNDCLCQLINMTDFTGVIRPIILFDILPSHGITLNTHIRNLINSGIIPEVGMEYQSKMNFIENNVLIPLGLTWSNIHLNFASPPSTVVHHIPNITLNNYPNVTIHAQNINTIGGGIAPNQNTLRDNIVIHGF
jgi:hypothetical protein